MSQSFVANGSSTENNKDAPPTATIPPYIPVDRPYRTLVVCFDGTGDQFNTDNSNVIEFFSLLKKDDPAKQLVYYQAGIGTYTIPEIATPFLAKWSKLSDEALAWDLDAHIMGGYEFLMQNYRVTDRICIFGFSRGSYTARCLAGMIHKVGLLPSCNHQQVPFAYKMYTTADTLGWSQSNLFKKTFSIDVDIEFVGVWDTVNSVGGLIPRQLPFTTSNTIICTFRHAVSLDERRAMFKANLWNRPEAKEVLLSISDQKIAAEAHNKGKAGHNHDHDHLSALEKKYAKERATPTNIDEVWFSGGHADVGGGSWGNGIKPSMARIPFRWMIRECFKTNSGILFNTEGMKHMGIDPASLYPVVLPRPPVITIESCNPKPFISDRPPKHPTPEELAQISVEHLGQSEEQMDLLDALAPNYDALELTWGWWILEILPLKQPYQTSDNKWHSKWTFNLGGGREIPPAPHGVRVHRSVKTRLDAAYRNGKKYFPKANLDLKNVVWVD